jgi:hypothetical protein
MADIASIQDDIKQYQEQVDFVNAGLKDDPGNAELLALKSDTSAKVQGALSSTRSREMVA